MQALVDLSTITNGQEPRYLDLVLSQLSPSRSIVFVPENTIAAPTAPNVILREFPATFDPSQRWSRFREELMNFCSPDSLSSLQDGERRVVISFNVDDVRRLVEEIADSRLAFKDYRSLVFPKKVTAWPEDVMPSEKGIRTLLAALKQEEGERLRMSAARPALERIDYRFKKQDNNPLAAAGTIKALIQLAEAQGYVQVGGQDPVNPYVYFLKDMPSTGGGDAAETSQLASQERMSDSFIRCLKTAELGPFQQVRVAIYDQIDRTIKQASEGGPQADSTIINIVEKALEHVSRKAEEAQREGRTYLVKSPDHFPWSKVRQFMFRLMSTSPCIISESNEVVTFNFLSMNSTVRGMAHNWRLRLDSTLLLHLIDNGLEIRPEMIDDLSGALYNTRRDLRNATTLTHYVISEGICVQDDSGILRRGKGFSS